MLNHAFTRDMARALSERAASSTGPEAIRTVYRHVLQRDPSPDEVASATSLIDRFGLEAFCRAVLNFNEVLYVD
jgi:hypothetical protein